MNIVQTGIQNGKTPVYGLVMMVSISIVQKLSIDIVPVCKVKNNFFEADNEEDTTSYVVKFEI